MKILLFAAIFLILFASCDKEKCVTCTTTIKYYGATTTPPSSRSEFNVCKTDDEIKDIEESGTFITNTTTGVITVTQESKTTCK